MDFLARDSVSLPEGFWSELDKTIVSAVRGNLVGRKFLSLYGPLGAGALSIQVDEVTTDEEDNDGIVKTVGRHFVELPQIYEDFTLLWRDLEYNEKSGFPFDFSRALLAAQKIANKEDNLIFFGSEFLGSEGLLTAKGAPTIEKSDWTEGENAFMDVATGLAQFRSKGIIGKYSLIVSPDLFAKLHRVIPSLGTMEVERISKMLEGRLFHSPVLGKNQAVLVCAEPQYIDLCIGKDIETGYLETRDFNHVLRIIETAALRIKCKDAIIVLN
ncbi:MAG: hypothetical protein K0S61_1736 [Anaerocolumna sp.]|jgi:uncharacterized linocin/CFP29 family protein|nr:hypothetical protein [Anaerocolumna sp.]